MTRTSRAARATTCLALAILAGTALAETATETAVRKIIEPRLGDEAKVDSVTKTPYGGLFEIRTGNEILYTDEKAQYLFVGRVLDSKTLQDYTKARRDTASQHRSADTARLLVLDSLIFQTEAEVRWLDLCEARLMQLAGPPA